MAMEVEHEHEEGIPRLSLKTSIQASFGEHDNPDYVFDIASSWDNSIMAVSLSTNVIKLYSPLTGQFLGNCLGHTNTITDLQFPDPRTPHTFCSSSADGTLRIWDTRIQQQVSMLGRNRSPNELFSFSIGGSNGYLVVAGSNAQVIFWDWRTQREVACLENCHRGDITQVRFHPSKRDKLVTASEDGLICVFDTKSGMDEDESLETVLSVGTSVGRIGFFGSDEEKLWCLTRIESLSIWNMEEGRREVDFGDTRSKASPNWALPPLEMIAISKRLEIANFLGNYGFFHVLWVDYLVHCHYSSATDKLWLVAGTNTGSVGYFPLIFTGSGSGVVGPVSAVLERGHVGVVRCIWSPLNTRVGPAALEGLFGWTGGEDGRLCSWFEGEKEGGRIGEESKGWVSSRLAMKRSPLKRQRPSPY